MKITVSRHRSERAVASVALQHFVTHPQWETAYLFTMSDLALNFFNYQKEGIL